MDQSLLEYEAPAHTFGFRYDRQWFVTSDEPNVAILRMIQRGELVAQCNISALLAVQKEITLAGFQQEIQNSLDKNFGQFVKASEETTPEGYRVYRVVANGDGFRLADRVDLLSGQKCRWPAAGIAGIYAGAEPGRAFWLGRSGVPRPAAIHDAAGQRGQGGDAESRLSHTSAVAGRGEAIQFFCARAELWRSGLPADRRARAERRSWRSSRPSHG